ncbi:MAG: radical SAM protein [Planctomycetes bacterium]|nr:radical SAM protein [Planctomycetota bacterium]
MLRAIIDFLFRGPRLSSLIFEVTPQCNHSCPHCYNAWKNAAPYLPDENVARASSPVCSRGAPPLDTPQKNNCHDRDVFGNGTHGQDARATQDGLLSTAGTIDMLGRALNQTFARHVTLTGGEPLLRADLYEIIDYLRGRRVRVNIITNGSLFTDQTIARLVPYNIDIFEIPLLSDDRAIHDRMSGRAGAFDDATHAMAALKSASQRVVAVFVATKLNLPTFERTLELAFALGVDGVVFNRFNPGGEGVKNLELLQAGPAELSAALDIADRFVAKYKLSISCSIPMPPCLFDVKKWPNLSFGFCAAGTRRAYYTFDWLGNVRPCNHSPTILGNIRAGSFRSMASGKAMRQFMASRPKFCDGCRMAKECQGGCKAAAQAACGDLCAPDPFLAAFQHQAVKVK